MSTASEHLPQRFEIPSDAPAGPVDPYQARMARAQRGYQADLDAAWGADAVRAEPEEPEDREEPWQVPAVDTEAKGPWRWLRRRREKPEAAPDAEPAAAGEQAADGQTTDEAVEAMDEQPAGPPRRAAVEVDMTADQ